MPPGTTAAVRMARDDSAATSQSTALADEANTAAYGSCEMPKPGVGSAIVHYWHFNYSAGVSCNKRTPRLGQTFAILQVKNAQQKCDI